MKRREFLGTVGVAAGTAWAGGAWGAGVPSKPNLLVIHTDQQSAWTLSAYGGDLIPTPHIDSLAREGAVFDNFFTNSAVCTPSRGCLLTGRYPHAHGAYSNKLELNRDEVTLANVLGTAGYDTGYAGKWHLDGEAKPGWVSPERGMGFADCRFMFNRGHWKKIEDREGDNPEAHPYRVVGNETNYTTDWLAGKTMDFLRKPRSKPFFYMVSIPDPHSPYTVREPYASMFKPEDMPIPSTFRTDEIPPWAKDRGLDKEKLRRWKAGYCGAVKCIDDNVGKILACLRETGQLDNTVVVFTTDHGDYMGEHGLMGKNQLYETAYRIPLLVRWPGRIKAGTRIGNILSTVDFMPTILGLLGVPGSGREQGCDASGLLLGGDAPWRDEAFLHHSGLERAGIFKPDYELAVIKDGARLLFNRKHDPEQKNNLYDDEAHREVRDELLARVVKHNNEVDAPAAVWLREMVASVEEST